MTNDQNSVDIEILLSTTRQKLFSAIIANTELEALVQELKTRIQELESKKNKDN
jgi:hypothetical protein